MVDEGGFDSGSIYEIAVRGRLDDRWAGWFDGMVASVERTSPGGQVTILAGRVADQAALRGILNKMWDLHLTVMWVTRTGKDDT